MLFTPSGTRFVFLLTIGRSRKYLKRKSKPGVEMMTSFKVPNISRPRVDPNAILLSFNSVMSFCDFNRISELIEVGLDVNTYFSMVRSI